MAHLVTGYAGYEHIKSADDRAYNAAFFGGGQYVMESGNQFEGSIIDNNTVRILDGDLLMYGGHVRIEPSTYEDLTIETGTAGKNRIDLICMTYEKNETDGTEKSFLQVIKGNATEGTAVAPTYTNGNILEGAVLNQMPLYKVVIEGVVLKEITQLFTVIPTYKTLAEKYAAQFEATIKALKDADILDTMEEVEANMQGNMFAGALALKEMHTKHVEDIASKVSFARADTAGFKVVAFSMRGGFDTTYLIDTIETYISKALKTFRENITFHGNIVNTSTTHISNSIYTDKCDPIDGYISGNVWGNADGTIYSACAMVTTMRTGKTYIYHRYNGEVTCEEIATRYSNIQKKHELWFGSASESFAKGVTTKTYLTGSSGTIVKAGTYLVSAQVITKYINSYAISVVDANTDGGLITSSGSPESGHFVNNCVGILTLPEGTQGFKILVDCNADSEITTRFQVHFSAVRLL